MKLKYDLVPHQLLTEFREEGLPELEQQQLQSQVDELLQDAANELHHGLAEVSLHLCYGSHYCSMEKGFSVKSRSQMQTGLLQNSVALRVALTVWF